MIKIDITFTEITYFEPITEEASTIKVTGKKTVKESKELIPTETFYISKEVLTETVEVSIDELLKITKMIKIDITFTEITYFEPITKEETTIKVIGKKTVKESKELIPTETIYISKKVLTETVEVSIDELLKITNKKENDEDEI